MVKKILSVFVCIMMLGSASLAFAGGTAAGSAPPPCGPYPYSAKPYGPPPASSAYWGDAPFPGMCGGVVALPFLVVGSLLGGNTAGPYGPPPGPGYNYGPPPGPGYNCAPPPCPPGKIYGPPAAAGCGPGYGAAGGSMFGGIPCLELCSSILGSIGGGVGFLY
jgi:hypothetical protein